MRRRRDRTLIAAVVLLLVLTLPQAGCWGKLELEDRSLVTLLGIDVGENKDILLTTVIAVPRASGAKMTSEGGDVGQTAVILSAEGGTLFEALDNIEILSSREISPSNATAALIGSDFAKRDMAPILDAFTRSLQFRDNILIAVCDGRATDFISNMAFVEETEPSAAVSKLITTVHRTLGACPLVTMHDFVSAYAVLGEDPWAPYLVLSGSSPPDEAIAEEQGGSTDRPKKKVRVEGAAVFAQTNGVRNMVGTLDRYQTFGVLVLRNGLKQGHLEINMPGEVQKATLFFHHSSVRVKAEVSQAGSHFAFTVRITGNLEAARGGLHATEPTDEFRQALRETGAQELQALFANALQLLRDLNSDVIGLGKHLQGRFSSYSQWESFDFPSRFPHITASFDVKMFLFTSGFTFGRPAGE